MPIVTDCETGVIPEATLGYSEMQDLYSILGVIASNEQIEEEFRVSLLNWALER